MNDLIPIESEEESSSPDQSDLEKSIITLNHLAMQNLEHHKANHVLFYLNQGLLTSKQILNTEVRSRLLALTYNNLACYFQSIKNSEKALDFLFKAVNLLSTSKDLINLSASHLNISSILTTMNQPERALRHALKCIYLLRNREKFSVTLVKAFLAAGNLYKTLKQIKDALECFQKGLALSRKHMGNNFTLTLLLRSALESIRCETLPKQRTSKILKKFTPILHQKTKSGFNESFQKKLDFGKSPAKSLERTRLFQEKMISTGRVMSSQRTRTRLSNISENRDFQAVTSAREEKVKIFQDLKSVDKGNGKILEEVNDLKKVCQFKDEIKQTGVKNCRNKERRFDIEHQRMQERLAAIFIQAWWRGACERREFERMKIQKLVLEAEEKAKIAADYALQLKIKAASLSSLRKPGRIERTKLNSAALQIQMYYKSFKARQQFSKIRRMTLAVKSFLVMIINRGRIPVQV